MHYADRRWRAPRKRKRERRAAPTLADAKSCVHVLEILRLGCWLVLMAVCCCISAAEPSALDLDPGKQCHANIQR
jgi:hypothetical protein